MNNGTGMDGADKAGMEGNAAMAKGLDRRGGATIDVSHCIHCIVVFSVIVL